VIAPPRPVIVRLIALLGHDRTVNSAPAYIEHLEARIAELESTQGQLSIIYVRQIEAELRTAMARIAELEAQRVHLQQRPGSDRGG